MFTNYRLYLKFSLQVSTKTGMKFLFANCFRSDFVVLLMKTVYLIVLRLMKFPDRPCILWFLGSAETFNEHKR